MYRILASLVSGSHDSFIPVTHGVATPENSGNAKQNYFLHDAQMLYRVLQQVIDTGRTLSYVQLKSTTYTDMYFQLYITWFMTC